ncbi:hypothetical protein BKM31_44970 [[Actinomadura] parvosata subsp. kistnae]|uniref:Uncharacterized protein n=1 Tax=[Actinomadura] parvosata subsp. kistnae TaxID=1909395 RepID=A0A1V0AC19_9ACTN|nr:hypothetical protein BKM31_44970 [Nonomuraea sp. ATCC 55076]
MAPNLRPTTVHAWPSMICCTKVPRWVRWVSGRNQSTTDSAPTIAAPASPTTTSRSNDTRLPDSNIRNTASPITNAGTPPKSAPQEGHPSAKTANAPYTEHNPTTTTLDTPRPSSH